MKPKSNFLTNDYPIIILSSLEKYNIVDDDIITTIKTFAPFDIDESIYFFPINKKYFITDKGIPYSIKYDLKGLSDRELNSYLYYGRKKNDDKQNKLIEEANRITPILHRLSTDRTTITIYLKDDMIGVLEADYGYTVKKSKIPTYHYTFKKDSKGFLKKYKINETEPHYSHYIEMNIQVYKQVCRNGKMTYKGYTFDDNGNEIKIKRGRGNTAFSFYNTVTGKEYKYDSIKQAAQQYFLIDESNLRKAIRKRTGQAFIYKGVTYMITMMANL